MQELTVTVEGVTFSGMRGPFAIGPRGLEGWDDGVRMRVNDTERTRQHGSLDLPSFLGTRTISISGFALAANSRELDQLHSRLSGLLVDGSTGKIQVTREGMTRWAYCKLGGDSLAWDEAYGQNYAEYQIQFWCPNGRKFGDRQQATIVGTGTELLYHYGNSHATPSFKVAGSAPAGYTLSSAAGTYAVTRPLVSGQPHTINFETGRLYVNGVLDSNSTPQADVWDIPPGGGLFTTLTTSGTATAVADLYDTYI